MSDDRQTFHLATFRLPSKNPSADKLKDAFDTARQFEEAAQRCFKPKIPIDGQDGYLVFPYVVNACFSCEMTLKALLLKMGESIPREHSLVALWDAVAAKAVIQMPIQLSAERFREVLSSIDKHFVQIRYNYELQNEIVSFGEDKVHLALGFLSEMRRRAESEPNK